MSRLNSNDLAPSVGIVTALPHETAALLAVIKKYEEIHVPGTQAGRRYWSAEVASQEGGAHHIVIAQSGVGNNRAAGRATQLLEHFRTVQSIIMCGIAGAVPQPQKVADHVRLGDIVVSNIKGIVQYDFVKRSVGEQGEKIEELRYSSHRPSALLTEAVDLLEVGKHLGHRPWEHHLDPALRELNWSRPEGVTDVLSDATNVSSVLDHPYDPERTAGAPRVFLGPIAAANSLLKDPVKRDALRDAYGVKAVEMESSGILDATWTYEVGYLVVRGSCDYCDSNKTDTWQRYAAVAAAAYVVALLESMPGNNAENPR
jgi:nucleoside phosphorylase